MAWGRAALGLVVAVVAAGILISGDSDEDSVRQRYLPASNELRTVITYGDGRLVEARSLGEPLSIGAKPGRLTRAEPLGQGAPRWAWRLYRRSLLVLVALTDRRTGAALAGLRDGWAYVWPRDAGTVTIALASAGYQKEARRIVRFLLKLDLDSAARFHPDGSPVDSRTAQGDASGWIAAAVRAVGMKVDVGRQPWRDRADYQEGDSGDYLANAITAGADLTPFVTERGLIREAGDPHSGLDSTAAWAVRPFPQRRFFPAARRGLLRIAATSGRFGVVPSEHWGGGDDPWTAPTAWTAWSLAALGERRPALRLMAALRRTATTAGWLPERVDVHTGIPTSTTPLAWSHAFAILAIRELWPRTASNSHPSR